MNRAERRRQQKKTKKSTTNPAIENALKIALGHHNEGRLAEAEDIYQHVLRTTPNQPVALHLLGVISHQKGHYQHAIKLITKALKSHPQYPEAHNNLGLALQQLGQQSDAIACFNKALALKPNFPAAHNSLANALQELGRLEDATASYRTAISQNPEHAQAHHALAHIIKHTQYGDDIKAMEHMLAKTHINLEQKILLAFALGKSFEDLGQHKKAFNYFLTANATKRELDGTAREDTKNQFKNLKKTFNPALFAKHEGAGFADETPIFILGMPRSGTSLVEQILASHPRVYGAGEVDALAQTIFDSFSKDNSADFPLNVSSEAFHQAGKAYVRTMRNMSKKACHITDKLPHNFKHIGMIKLLLPKAKIIHCKRNPEDTCLSIFKTYFPAKGLSYAYELCELGQHYALYQSLMDHWHHVLPGFVYDINYEDLVTDQEGQSKSLLAHLGLDWDDACLTFYKTRRVVHTASATQVRQPIYKDSIQSWKRYETQLSPLLKALRL